MKIASATKIKETDIGLIPEEWSVLPIYDLAEWINGLAFKNIHFTSDGKPVIKINELKYGITDQTQFTQDIFDEDYLLKKKDLLFSWSGSPDTSIDAFWYNLPDGWLNQHIFKIKPKSEVMRDFLYYILKDNKPRFIDIARDKQTTGLGHVTIGDLKRFDVALPGLDEQQRIASILSSLDDKIELNRQINANLEKMASALFKRWFVDFEFPDKRGRPYKTSGGKMVESGLGEIPAGWKIGALTDVCVLNPPYKIQRDAVAKYVEMKDLPEAGSGIKGYIERRFTAGSKFGKHDTLLARITPCLENGKTGFVDFLEAGEVGWGSTEFIVIHPKSKDFEEYLYLLSRSKDFREFAIQSMSGSSGRQRVQVDRLMAYQVIVPSEDVIASYHELASALFVEMRSNNDQATVLMKIRDSLLPRLMSGKIRTI